MRWKQTLQLVEAHCEGEIGRIVTAGCPPIPGNTMAEKLAWMDVNGNGLRRLLVQEPRGAAAGSVNILLPPTRPDADAGFIVLQADQAHAMSGSNAMCLVTALLETGYIQMQEPETLVRLDTAAGLVDALAYCKDGKCERVSLDMPPAFVEALDAEIETENWGRLRYDLAFGGVFYALVDVKQLGLEIEPRQAHLLAAAGARLRSLLRTAVSVRHPEVPEIEGVAYVTFRDYDADGALRLCTTLWPGRVDRSPCGTGSSANLATLHARGLVKQGEVLRSRSTIGSEFEVEFLGEAATAERVTTRSRISGRSWIYGIHQIGLDPADPFPQGFLLSDTWGPQVGVSH